MVKTFWRSAILALVAATATATATATAASVPDYPFVHVTGSAFQAVPPDIGTLDFEVVAVDADPAAGRALLETRVGEARALMQQLGLDPEDAQVREVRQSIRKEEKAASGAPLYEVRCDVHINVRNLAAWPALASGLLGKPNLDGFASAFDLSTMDQVSDELTTQAIQDARHRADVMAAAFGRRVGIVMAATPDTLKNLGTAMGLERGDFRSRGETGRERAQEVNREQLLAVPALKLRQPVDVLFRLEPLAGKRAR